MISYDKLISLIDVAKNIAIIGHISPDGDTFGCCLAFQSVLLKMGKTVDFFCEGEVEKSLAENFGDYTVNPSALKVYDLAIAVDCSSHDRLGIYFSLFRSSRKKVVIDHHISHRNFGDLDLVEIRSSTGEMIFELVEKYYPSFIDDEFAKYIYISVLTDSGAFAFDAVSSDTFAIMAKLYKRKVDFAGIYYSLMRNQKLSSFRVQSFAKSNAVFFCQNQIAFITFTLEDFARFGGEESDTFGAINDIININEVKIAVSITEAKKYSFKVSVRTKDPISSAEIAKSFGGGGHKNAAGFRINGYKENVIDDILKICKDNL